MSTEVEYLLSLFRGRRSESLLSIEKLKYKQYEILLSQLEWGYMRRMFFQIMARCKRKILTLGIAFPNSQRSWKKLKQTLKSIHS